MILYHGSPHDLNILKPTTAKGLTDFEDLTAIHLTKTFLHAALYAIGKTLNGKTGFTVKEDQLIIISILSDLKPLISL